MFQLFNEFMAPEGEAPKAGSGTLDTIDLLLEDDEKTEPLDLTEIKEPKEDKEDIDEKDKEDKEDEEVDELKEIEEELEEPSEDDLELTTPIKRREILAKYPKLFKDFPYLEKAYYREQQFTELLPTIADAKMAVEKAAALDTFDRDITNGDISTILEAVKKNDSENFLKIADNYLPALKKVDSQVYYHIMGNIVKDTIHTMVREARNMGENGRPLQDAATILNQFIFGTSQFTMPTNLSKIKRPEEGARETELRNREQQFAQQELDSAVSDLQTKADNVLRATIDGHIDPKNSMTDYVKGKAIKDAFENLETLIGKDTRFRSILDRLWQRARDEGYSQESRNRIKSAYLTKAKTLLPSVIKQARNTALKGMGKRGEGDESVVSKPRQTPDSKEESGRSAAPKSGKFKKASDIPRGMSTLDVLNAD